MLSRQVRRHMPGDAQLAMAAIMNPKTWTEWRPGLLGVNNLSDEPLQSASAWVEEWRLEGRTVRMLARTIEVDPPHTFAYRATGDGLDIMFRWTAKGDDERTLVVREAKAQSSGLRNWLSHAAQGFLQQQDPALDNLRRILRSGLNHSS